MKKEYIKPIAHFIKQQSGSSITESEQDELSYLMENDEEFRVIVEKIKDGDYLAELQNFTINGVEERIQSRAMARIEEKKRKKIQRKRLLSMISAAAAVIAIIITTSFLFVNKPSTGSLSEMAYNKIEQIDNDVILITDKGENIKLTGTTYTASEFQKDTIAAEKIAETGSMTIVVPLKKEFNIVLPDSTRVWLNSGSKLTFPNKFDGKERVVVLDGEGYFEVSHNAAQPFIVRNLIMDTKVLGTKFLVTAYSNDDLRSISLVEGSVEVTSLVSDHYYKLIPGKGVFFDSDTHQFQMKNIKINNVLDRVGGMLIFENESLESICNTLSRRYAVEFVFTNESIKEKLFFVKTKKYDLIENVMSLLNLAGGIQYEISGNTITIK